MINVNNRSIWKLLQVKSRILLAYPRRSNHVVHKVGVASFVDVFEHFCFAGLHSLLFLIWLESPELGHAVQSVLDNLVICIYECRHVRLQPFRCVLRHDREPQLNVVFRIRSNDKVNVIPVCQQPSLYVANNFRQVFAVNIVQVPVSVSCNKVAVQLLRIVHPLRTQNLKVVGFEGISVS